MAAINAGINSEAVNTVLSDVRRAHYKTDKRFQRNLMHQPIQPDRIDLVRRQFADAYGAFAQHNAVFQNISERMFARLELLAIEPARVLDLGCRDGYQLAALQTRFPQAQIIGADPISLANQSARRWWPRKREAFTRLSADPHSLPFADASFDLVVSNLLLPWCHEPAAVFQEVSRVLVENGAFMFTTAGPDTLCEYAQLWSTVDDAQHVFGLADMHNTGDEMLSAGFNAPVLDREVISIDYPSVDALQLELRQLGAANIARGRRSGLMSPLVRKLIKEAAPDQRFSVTLELVQGHGWKGALAQNRNNSSDEYSISLDSLRQSLRGLPQ